MDVPNVRSSHKVPVPRGGGLACVAGIAAALIVTRAQGRAAPWLLLIVVAVLSIAGFADDRGSLPAGFRLATQVAAGASMGAVVGGGGWIALGAIVVPSVANSVNFMDGINGITSLTMGVWGVTALLVGNARAIPPLSVIGALVVGSALGFLPWNAPKARMFLGDTGSYLFGAMAAAGLLLGWSKGAPVVLLAAPLFLYLLDTGIVLAKRALRGAPLFEAHREHTYQRLTAASGLPHIAVALGAAILSAVITVSWTVQSAAVSLAATALGCGLYLFSPSIVARRVPQVESASGGAA
jgi:UDP-N-acetylmuramyl pentapeptide phosphotransferase/UDP-N-acetylglucosamine-1-phosphate transferase